MRVQLLLATIVCLFSAALAQADDPFAKVSREVNDKMVKIFGAGGFRGVTNYSTGIIVSPDGHIITIASQTLDTSELIVHLSDGRRMKAVVVVTEPELDIALVRIKLDDKKPEEPTGLNLPYFNVSELAKRPKAEVSDWVLAFSNQFEIAMRNEPVSVQRGAIMAVANLSARRGIFDFPYNGEVYVVDAITNNPGAGGGALTDRKGNLLGILGREIKNSLSETWINYAIPIQAMIELEDGDKKVQISIVEFVEKAMKGEYKPVSRPAVVVGRGGFHGVRFVPDILERTPPFIEEFFPSSPAAKAGLKINDLISFVDGEPIYSIKAFNEFMSRTRPGMTLRFEVRRGDNLQTVEVKLEEWPKELTPKEPNPPPLPVDPKKD